MRGNWKGKLGKGRRETVNVCVCKVCEYVQFTCDEKWLMIKFDSWGEKKLG